MKNDLDTQFLCKDCERYLLCQYYDNRKEESYICKYFHSKFGQWIPVSERLPEFRKEVLTCSNGGFIEIQSLEDSYDGYWENQKGDWTDLEEIIAWMPLPQPYQAESEE